MPHSIGDLPSALENFDQIARRLDGRRLAVFLDFDGTLAPIAERPEKARLAPAMRAAVADLAAVHNTAIISGRGREDVRALVGLDALTYAGDHGFDISFPDGGIAHNIDCEPFHAVIGDITERLEKDLAAISGAFAEPKWASVAVHYRQTPAAETAAVETAVKAVIADFDGLRLTPGKMVYEIQPDFDWNKGKAVQWLLEKTGLSGPGVVPVYIGDDVTDEDAFAAIAGSGIGIFVDDQENSGPDRTSAANYKLRNPDEVELLLRKLAAC